MEKLFTPIKLGDVEMKNRVILPSMCVHFCEKDGHMNDCFREYVRRRAAGGAGLLIIPGSPHGKPAPGVRLCRTTPISRTGGNWRI